jgi:hypothetical protein
MAVAAADTPPAWHPVQSGLLAWLLLLLLLLCRSSLAGCQCAYTAYLY